MHHFVTEMCTCVHISVTNWCIVGYKSNALWNLWDVSILMYMRNRRALWERSYLTSQTTDIGIRHPIDIALTYMILMNSTPRRSSASCCMVGLVKVEFVSYLFTLPVLVWSLTISFYHSWLYLITQTGYRPYGLLKYFICYTDNNNLSCKLSIQWRHAVKSPYSNHLIMYRAQFLENSCFSLSESHTGCLL